MTSAQLGAGVASHRGLSTPSNACIHLSGYGALADPEGDCTCILLVTRTAPGREVVTVSTFRFTSAL